MKIIQRKKARAAGLNTYFTGFPCKNGHTAYRYVTSGTCSACIAASNHGVRVTIGAQASERKAIFAQLKEVRVLAHEKDLVMLSDLAQALFSARFPGIQMAGLTQVRHSPIYRFRLHPDDIPLLSDTARVMWAAQPIDTHIIEAVLQEMLHDAESPTPAWADKP